MSGCRWAWERDLPPPPRRGQVLRQMILEYLSCSEPKTIPQVHWEVLNDYGSVSIRTMHRHFNKLVSARRILRVGAGDWFLDKRGGDAAYEGYVRVAPGKSSRRRPMCNLASSPA